MPTICPQKFAVVNSLWFASVVYECLIIKVRLAFGSEAERWVLLEMVSPADIT